MTPRWRSPAGALTLVAILLGSGASGFLFHRAMKPPPATVAAQIGTTPAAEAARPAAAPTRATPEALPDFSLPDTLGKPHRLADWKGRSLVINFWATWCEPCRREIPLLEALRRENSRNTLEIVGIAIDHLNSVQKYVMDMKIDYPVLVGEEGGLEAAAAFGMEPVLPFTVFADAKGRIVTLKVGELHRDEAAFILARLSDVGAGRLSLVAAREQIADQIRRLAVSRTVAGSD